MTTSAVQQEENARAIAWQDQQRSRKQYEQANKQRLRGNEQARRELEYQFNPPLRRPDNEQ